MEMICLPVAAGTGLVAMGWPHWKPVHRNAVKPTGSIGDLLA